MKLFCRILLTSAIFINIPAFSENSTPVIQLTSGTREVFNFLPGGWRSSVGSATTIFIDTSFKKVTFWSEIAVNSPGNLAVELQGRFPAQAQIYAKLLKRNQSAVTAVNDSAGWFSVEQGATITLPRDPNKVSQINNLTSEIQNLNNEISSLLSEISDLRARIAVSSGARRDRLRASLRRKREQLAEKRSLLANKNEALEAIRCRPITRSVNQEIATYDSPRILVTSDNQTTCNEWYNYYYSSEMSYSEYLTELKNGIGTMCNYGMIDPNCKIAVSGPSVGNPSAYCSLVPNRSPACASVPSAPSSYSAMSDSFACSAYFDILSNGTGFDYRIGKAVVSTNFALDTCSLSSRYLIKAEIDFPGTTWSSIWNTPYGPDNIGREIEENNLLYRDLMSFNSQLGSLSAFSVFFNTDF